MSGPKVSGCLALFLFLVEYTAANCAMKLDLVFIIDGSRAIPKHDFSKLKQAVLALLRCMHERDEVHAGVIVYGSTLARPIALSGDRNKLTVLERIDPPLGEPVTHIAVLNGRSLFRKRGRAHVIKIAVLLTSGLGNFVQETIRQAELARGENYRFIVVTLAENVAGADSLPWRPGDIFKLRNVNEMVEELGKIARKICSVARASQISPVVSSTTLSPAATLKETIMNHNLQIPQQERLPVDFGGVCSQCQLVDGVGYAKHPEDCEKFVVCYPKTTVGWYHVIQTCGVGEFWDQTMLACRIADVVDCPQDKCKDSQQLSVAHPTNCKTFYRCEKGRSISQCCEYGTAYVSGPGCVSNTTCLDLCPPEVTPKPGSCDKAPVYGRPEIYSQYVPGSYWIEMMCANGSRYDDRMCSCSDIITKPWSTDVGRENPSCKPKLYLPFCDGIKDHSGGDSTIENEGDGVVVVDGKAFFNGHSSLYLPGFSEATYGDTVVIKLKYKIEHRPLRGGNSDSGEYEDFGYYDSFEGNYDYNGAYDVNNEMFNAMTLVSNGDCYGDDWGTPSCYENPSITIGTNRRTTVFELLTTEDSNATFINLHKSVDDKNYDDVDVDYYDDDEYYSYLLENEFRDETNNCSNDTWDDEWRTVMFFVHNNTLSVYDGELQEHRPISGLIRTTSVGLQIGQGSEFQNFRGFMDEISVYLCRPDDSVLFDDLDMFGSGPNDTSSNGNEHNSTISTESISSSNDSNTDSSSKTKLTFADAETTEFPTQYSSTMIQQDVHMDASSVSNIVTPDWTSSNDKRYSTKSVFTDVMQLDSTSMADGLEFHDVTSSDVTTWSSESKSVIKTTLAAMSGTAEPVTEASSKHFSTLKENLHENIPDQNVTEKPYNDVDMQNRENITAETLVYKGNNSDIYSILDNITSYHEKSNVFENNYSSVFNFTDQNIFLNDSLTSVNDSIYFLKKLVKDLTVENNTLTLETEVERKGNHCCINSYIYGAISEKNRTTKEVPKANGAILHNENDQSGSKDDRTVGQTGEYTTDETIQNDNTTDISHDFYTKLHSFKFDDEQQNSTERLHANDSERNVTRWRPEH